MIEYPNLVPECNVDTVFVEMLGYKEPNYAPNINEVFIIFERGDQLTKALKHQSLHMSTSAFE